MVDIWTLVPITEDMNIQSGHWVFTIKFNHDGTVRNLKSRLVARGNEKEEGLDYLKTFSPMVRTTTIRLVLDVHISKYWSLRQLGVTSAFFMEGCSSMFTCINLKVLLIQRSLIMCVN